MTECTVFVSKYSTNIQILGAEEGVLPVAMETNGELPVVMETDGVLPVAMETYLKAL